MRDAIMMVLGALAFLAGFLLRGTATRFKGRKHESTDHRLP